MKITQVAVDVLRVPVERPYVAGGRTVDANWHVLARITTSHGVEGIGYAGSLSPSGGAATSNALTTPDSSAK